jgi:hypothetical protein
MDICTLFVALDHLLWTYVVVFDLVCDLFVVIDHCIVDYMLYALNYVAIVSQMLAFIHICVYLNLNCCEKWKKGEKNIHRHLCRVFTHGKGATRRNTVLLGRTW